MPSSNYIGTGSSWTQKGSNDGTADSQTWSTDLSSDGTILAVAYKSNSSKGHVQTFKGMEQKIGLRKI